jgi:hypothetical protein
LICSDTTDPDPNERSLSAPCPKFEPDEKTPSTCDKQSGISSSTNTKCVNMWNFLGWREVCEVIEISE